jgi:hypothetical protein
MFSGCARKGKELPGDFPPGLTTYPGSEIISQFQLGPAHHNGYSVRLASPASLRDISVFYFKQAQELGLKPVADFDMVRMFGYYFGNDDYIVNIRATLEENGLVYVDMTGCLGYKCPNGTRLFRYRGNFLPPQSAYEIDVMRMGYKYHMFFKSTDSYEGVLSNLRGRWNSSGWECLRDSTSGYQGDALRIAIFTKEEDMITCYLGESLDGDTACLVELFRLAEVPN